MFAYVYKTIYLEKCLLITSGSNSGEEGEEGPV